MGGEGSPENRGYMWGRIGLSDFAPVSAAEMNVLLRD